KVRVIFKKKFEKGYMPDWSDEVYTVESVSKGRDQAPMTHRLSHQPIIDSQAMYLLRDPNNTLNKYKEKNVHAQRAAASSNRQTETLRYCLS
ncbi:MAG: hypothetical protein ACKPKO_25775, partial [Candidatus Fonsibacter sp.]